VQLSINYSIVCWNVQFARSDFGQVKVKNDTSSKLYVLFEYSAFIVPGCIAAWVDKKPKNRAIMQ
jgi:hypothetical protein